MKITSPTAECGEPDSTHVKHARAPEKNTLPSLPSTYLDPPHHLVDAPAPKLLLTEGTPSSFTDRVGVMRGHG